MATRSDHRIVFDGNGTAIRWERFFPQ